MSEDRIADFIAEETPPQPKAMINTFRAFGYNLQTAIADIIDNCISARADNVWVQYTWAGADSWVSITDDGTGMSREELVQAMTPGSKDPQDDREEHDLGRFGLGLKTASFSQCKSLTVLTKREGFQLIKRCWDLDFVNQEGKWFLLDYLSDEEFSASLTALKRGTTVVWEKLDRLVGNAHHENEAARAVFLEEFEVVEHHLSIVFHRYLEQKRFKLWINGRAVEPFDPFLKEIEATQLLAQEKLDNDKVKVKCYLLPHISKLSLPECKKYKTDLWNEMQGFYIYRNNRLLLHGDWLGLFARKEHYKNARILIDIPNHLDYDWKIDIKKATATPSVAVRKDLVRLGKLTRKSAADVHRFRGNQLMREGSVSALSFQPVWKVSKSRDDARHYTVNEEHPVVKELLEKDSVKPTELRQLLKLIGQTTPVETIIQFHNEEPQSHERRDVGEEPDEATIKLASRLYKSLLSQGVGHNIAIQQIFNIEPFNEYPQLIEYFK